MEKFEKILIDNFKSDLKYSLKKGYKENEFIYTYENYNFKEFTIDFICELIDEDEVLIRDDGQILRMIIREGGEFSDVKKMFTLTEKEAEHTVTANINDVLGAIDEITKKIFYLLLSIEF